jgi:glycosyltransferase involved in cell wall biosynthesis
VRLGIDMLGVQSPESRNRGIGRYARSLVESLVRLDPRHEYVLYTHQRLPIGTFPEAPNATVRPLPAGPTAERSIDALARDNPDGLDGLLLTAPFELHDDYSPPAKPLNGLVVASVVYDMVPFLFQERHLTYAPIASRFYRNLERLRQYDALLAISEATRGDVLNLLGIPDGRVVMIGAASDPGFFVPESPGHPSTAAVMARLGVTGPFVFGLSNMEERKNLDGLLGAFHALPSTLRASHQIVLAGAFSDDDASLVRRRAGDAGILGSLVLTGPISDDVLRALYQRCSAFVFPSRFEGFGLPLLEAMHCGAVVIGGNNSSQVEVVGDGGFLANADDPLDIAARLQQVLEDAGLAAALRSRAVRQAARFRWELTAERTLAALTRAIGRARKPRRRADPLRRLAVVSAWPPRKCTTADAALRVARELKHSHDIDLYHESGYEPVIGIDAHDFRVFDHRLLKRNAAPLDYQNVVYLLGNSADHRFMRPLLQKHPGVVVVLEEDAEGFERDVVAHARKVVSDPLVLIDELKSGH